MDKFLDLFLLLPSTLLLTPLVQTQKEAGGWGFPGDSSLYGWPPQSQSREVKGRAGIFVGCKGRPASSVLHGVHLPPFIILSPRDASLSSIIVLQHVYTYVSQFSMF